MRLSEVITIYLAAGAPFGLQNFLCRRSGARSRSLSGAVRAALLWPLAAARFLFSRRCSDETATRAAQLNEKVSRAQGKVLSSLYGLAELLQSSAGAERAVRTVRESVEKYVGLTLAAAELDPNGEPCERELELYRVAGRKGPDLLLAGRCARRRNAARLVKSQARSRVELLNALAQIREWPRTVAGSEDSTAERHASVAIVRLYACAHNLLSLLKDEAAAAGVSKLLDAECARLRRLEETCRAYTTPMFFTGKNPQPQNLSSS